MKPLTIGEVARQAGVGIETVRFYERQGLLEEPERRASGYRQFDQEAVAVLKFIRRAKELGFTLKEIKSLLALRMDASATKAEVREQAKAKVADIEAKIADLQRPSVKYARNNASITASWMPSTSASQIKRWA